MQLRALVIKGLGGARHSHAARGMSERSDDTSDSVENSELGRKEHWDAVYEQELADLHECGQEGELW